MTLILNPSSRSLIIGTDFFIYLPVMDKKKLDNQEDAPEISSLLPVGSERILLVDDEKQFVTNMARILKVRGFDVTTAFDGSTPNCRAAARNVSGAGLPGRPSCSAR